MPVIIIAFCLLQLQNTRRDFTVILVHMSLDIDTGSRSAVGNVSGNRCESDCRSRGREFNPGPVPYFSRD